MPTGPAVSARVPHLGYTHCDLAHEPTRYLVIVWPGLLTFMGVTCLVNARHCGRIHCYFTGPFFLVLAGVALCWVPEWILGRYRSSSNSS